MERNAPFTASVGEGRRLLALRDQRVHLCRQLGELLLGCAERGGGLRIFRGKLLGGAVFVNGVATERSARHMTAAAAAMRLSARNPDTDENSNMDPPEKDLKIPFAFKKARFVPDCATRKCLNNLSLLLARGGGWERIARQIEISTMAIRFQGAYGSVNACERPSFRRPPGFVDAFASPERAQRMCGSETRTTAGLETGGTNCAYLLP